MVAMSPTGVPALGYTITKEMVEKELSQRAEMTQNNLSIARSYNLVDKEFLDHFDLEKVFEKDF